VAVLGGSGSYAIKNAIMAGADAFNRWFKVPSVLRSRKPTPLADIGHFESERYTKKLYCWLSSEKILNFAIILSEENTNPVKYL
jgi:putative NIF3 family GTP cyclohydrolase 1 type 2